MTDPITLAHITILSKESVEILAEATALTTAMMVEGDNQLNPNQLETRLNIARPN